MDIKFDEQVRFILGRPNFACSPIAEVLRSTGREIPKKAEDEQAHVIYWMLEMYEEHGADWKDKADLFLKDAVENWKYKSGVNNDS